MKLSRMFLLALRQALRTRSCGALLLLAFGSSMLIALRAEPSEARGLLAYGVIPLLSTLFIVREGLERASTERCAALDFERLYGGQPELRIGLQVLARALCFTLALALAWFTNEAVLTWREDAPAAPLWTERPFRALARKRLDRNGTIARLPSFEYEAGDTLVLPLRWRGEPGAVDPIQLVVRWSPKSAEGVREERVEIHNSLPLRLVAPAATSASVDFLKFAGSGDVRLDLNAATIERGTASHASSGALLLLRSLVWSLALAALTAALRAWLKPGLCLLLSASLWLWLLFDPLKWQGWQPAPAALLELGAWAALEPTPWRAAPLVPFLLLISGGMAIAAWGDRMRSVP